MSGDGEILNARVAVSGLRVSARCRQSLKLTEDLSLTAYPDPATGGKPWTIGYGHTGGVRRGMRISLAQAEQYLTQDIMAAERIVRHAVAVPMTQGEFDACVHFVFNVGPGAKGVKDGFVTLKSGKPSTMLRKINAGDYAGAAMEFPKWAYGAGKVMGGLVSRRAKERRMFEGAYGVA